MEKRAIGITTQEISVIFFIISVLLTIVAFKFLFDLYFQILPINPGISLMIILSIFILIVTKVFDMISVALPNYKISKEELQIFVDKITNPDYIGWLRCTRTKGIRTPIVKCGPLGQTKGMAYGEKADVINNGDYTLTTSNGNKIIIVNDLLSSNINLDEIMGLNLIQKHHGMIGFDAYEYAVEKNELMFKEEPVSKTGENPWEPTPKDKEEKPS